MKKTIFAAIAASAVVIFLITRKRKKVITSNEPPLTKRIGNEEKHLTTVFSRAKKNVMPAIKGESE